MQGLSQPRRLRFSCSWGNARPHRHAACSPCHATLSAPAAAPAFIPQEQLAEILDPDARRMASYMRRIPLSVPLVRDSGPLLTAVAGPSDDEAAAYPPDAPCAILLHGFDSNCLEFRRLQPLLAQHMPTYALDLVGWGFTDHSWLVGDSSTVISPASKRAHLRAFLEQHPPLQGGRRKVLLLGASLGGTVAADFALHHPELVSRLVLADPQLMVDGIGLLPSLPRSLAELGVKFLRTEWLRQQAINTSYYDKATFASKDTMRVARLHTSLPGWLEANLAFIRSGGYALSKRVKDLEVPTLLLWGRNDEILDPASAPQLAAQLPPGSSLVYVDECGHCPHHERADFTAQRMLEFVGVPEVGLEGMGGVDGAAGRQKETASLAPPQTARAR